MHEDRIYSAAKRIGLHAIRYVAEVSDLDGCPLLEPRLGRKHLFHVHAGRAVDAHRNVAATDTIVDFVTKADIHRQLEWHLQYSQHSNDEVYSLHQLRLDYLTSRNLIFKMANDRYVFSSAAAAFLKRLMSAHNEFINK